MALSKVKECGGSGGRLGHSNMSHWSTTEDIKVSARKRRRRIGVAQIALELGESEGDSPAPLADDVVSRSLAVPQLGTCKE